MSTLLISMFVTCIFYYTICRWCFDEKKIQSFVDHIQKNKICFIHMSSFNLRYSVICIVFRCKKFIDRILNNETWNYVQKNGIWLSLISQKNETWMFVLIDHFTVITTVVTTNVSQCCRQKSIIALNYHFKINLFFVYLNFLF